MERPVRRAGEPAEPLTVQQGGAKAVLVACEYRDSERNPYRQWGRAHVIVLDGGLIEGTVEVTPENGRLIENSPWLPARRPYLGLEGRIRILSVTQKGVLADCSVRNVIKRTGDPVYPLRGLQTFKFATVDESVLNRCGIQTGPEISAGVSE